MNVPRTLALILVAFLVALGTGCGGGDGGGDTTTEATTSETTTEPAETTGGDQTTSISMDEYSFDPSDAAVKKGATVDVKNDGAIAHNLTIEQGPDPKEKSKQLAGTSTFVGGKSEDLKVDLDAGKYAMVCTVAGHRELGMAGTITVK